jgi:signal transduction histidine kinase
MVDITERKQVENMKDQFISVATHELRTPLASIKGYMELILEEKIGPVSAEVGSCLGVVKRNADRLSHLTDDMLDLRRLESGKFELNLEPVSFHEIVDDCVSEIAPFLNEKKQRLHLELADGPIRIQADPIRLSQVLVNLLSNACKFTPERGEIRIRVEGEAEEVKVQISDNGIGIRKGDLERVFEPFAAIQKSTYVKGTGLGLAVTKALVEAHGGRIWAESEGEGKGSMFTFTLPREREAV